MMSVPIPRHDRVEGLLFVVNQSPRPFTDREQALLVRLADHAAIAIANAKLYDEVRRTSERLQTLSRRRLEVEETERRRLARELHDEMGQSLTAVKLNLQILERLREPAATRERLAETTGIVDGLIQQVRELSLDLRPSMLDDLGLAVALRWYVKTYGERTGLAADVATDLGGARLPGEVDLLISDDGVGFDVSAARERATRGASLGLLSMEERMVLLGGRMEIRSAPGRGTELHARLPLPV